MLLLWVPGGQAAVEVPPANAEGVLVQLATPRDHRHLGGAQSPQLCRPLVQYVRWRPAARGALESPCQVGRKRL